jgi:putative endopeptidase
MTFPAFPELHPMRLLPLLLASTLIAGTAAAQPAMSGKPTYGSFGFDEAGMDRAAKPGDDFYEFANGDWLKSTEIPADRSNYGMFTRLQDLSLTRTRGILDTAAKQSGSQIGDFYGSFMDEAAVDAAGATPVKPWLARIAAAPDKSALAVEMATLSRQGVTALFYSFVSPDDKDPTKYIAQFGQSGLGLPDRDYYLKTDAKIVETRTAYVAYLAKLLTLAGERDADARAKAVMAFETALAQVHWTRIDSRDATKTYNKFTTADFAARAPGFDWTGYLGAMGLAQQPDALVAQPSAFTGEAKLWADTPIAVLKDWLTLRTLNDYAPYLSKPFVDTEFAFNGTTLGGAPQIEPRWKRGVRLVSDQMGEAIGKDYVAQYFPPEAKAAADQLVHNLIAAYRQRLAVVPWMDPATRQKALEKLAAFTPKIGYPDKWRDYSTLAVRRGDLVGNVARGSAFEYQRNLDKLGKPIDRGEWGMTPMEINAYANPVMNEVVFPAAILQPPFFDPKADPAINYGGIGAVIGHELSHHFDDQGRKYDATGKLADWWTPQDVTRFTALTDELVKQYDGYEPLPGQHVQGGLTLGENMADLAGITVAHQAYQISLGGKAAPVLDGFTGEQRFYLGWAQVWRIKYREPNLRQRLLTDPHSPGPQRVDEVRNRDDWYAAFSVKPGEKLYLPPAERVKVW